MMLEEKFRVLGEKGRTAFMPYVCVGDPTADDTVSIAEALISSGADILELGLPFSDPIADGPTIQRASQRALEQGMNTDEYFRVCRKISRLGDASLVSMTYFNLVYSYGLEKFVSACRDAGICAIIVPDLPIEESEEFESVCVGAGVDFIHFVSLTTGGERLKRIVSRARGFVYLTSVLGVTGARDELDGKVYSILSDIRKLSDVPVCLGFGISREKHVVEAKRAGFSGVIVGSALIDVIEKNLGDKKAMLEKLSEKAMNLSGAT